MKNLSLIAAIGKNRELGKNNDLIWKIKEDMQHFRNKTMNHPIVMGYRTYKSLPKLLPGRLHVVISRTKIDNPDVITYNNLEEVLRFIEEYDGEVLVIGGAKTYKDMLEYCDKLYLTEIDDLCLDADVYFPEFDKTKYEVIEEELKEGNPSFKFKTYKKK